VAHRMHSLRQASMLADAFILHILQRLAHALGNESLSEAC